MILLCWAATFGAESDLDRYLEEPRALADGAAQGSWVPHDRGTLGVLFYRGLEHLRLAAADDGARIEGARNLLRTAAQAYRATQMLDVVPVSLGHWAEAERRLGDPTRARELALEAAALLESGHPSLLNEAPVYLALHDACVDLGLLREARDAIQAGLPRLEKRLGTLRDTPYARPFATLLGANAGLVAAAEAYGLLPDAVREIVREA
jgi:hypothetical protein